MSLRFRWSWRCPECGATTGGFRKFRTYVRSFSSHMRWYHPDRRRPFP